MFGLNFIRDVLSSIKLYLRENHKTGDLIVYEKNGIKAMKVDGFPTIIQAGSMTIMQLDGVATDKRLRKISETEDDYNRRMNVLYAEHPRMRHLYESDDEYNLRMRLLDEQEK